MSVERAALYLRVSTQEQAREGFSLEGQKGSCRDYCDRQGYRVARIYQDRLSGTTDKRPAFHAMLAHAQAGLFDVLVVWKRDRFFRDAVEAGWFERKLRGYGVRIEDVGRGPLEDTAVNRFTNMVFDAVAELENAQRAERCAMGRLTAARAGRWPRAPPYGYAIDRLSGRLTVDLDASMKVREAYRECIRGANRARLAAIMGCAGYTACHRLRNPAYKGEAVYSGVRVPCPPIVDAETWQKAQDAMDERFQNCDQFGRVIHPRDDRSLGTPGQRPAATRSSSGTANA